MGYLLYESLFFLMFSISLTLYLLFKYKSNISKLVRTNLLYIFIIISVFFLFFLPHLNFELFPEGVHVKHQNALLYENPQQFVPPRLYGGFHFIYYPFTLIEDNLVMHSAIKIFDISLLLSFFIILYLFIVKVGNSTSNISKINSTIIVINFLLIPNFFRLFYWTSLQPNIGILFMSILFFSVLFSLYSDSKLSFCKLLFLILCIYSLVYYRLETIFLYVPLFSLIILMLFHSIAKKLSMTKHILFFTMTLFSVVFILFLIQRPLFDLNGRFDGKDTNFDINNRLRDLNFRMNFPLVLLGLIIPVAIFPLILLLYSLLFIVLFIFSNLGTPYFFFFQIYSPILMISGFVLRSFNKNRMFQISFLSVLIVILFAQISLFSEAQENIIRQHNSRHEGFNDIVNYVFKNEISGIYVYYNYDYVYKIIFDNRLEYDLELASYCIGGSRFGDECYGCGDGELWKNDVIPENFSRIPIKKSGMYHLCEIRYDTYR